MGQKGFADVWDPEMRMLFWIIPELMQREKDFVWPLLALKMEGAIGAGCRRPVEAGKDKEWTLLTASGKNAASADILILGQRHPF